MRTLGLGAILVGLGILVGYLALPAAADAGDVTLRRYLDGSDVVVDATLRSFTGPWYDELGVANYGVELEVHAYVKGTLPLPPKEARVPGQPVRPHATIVRLELVDADRLPYLKKDARVVLFLKELPSGSFPRHETSDVWFGVQPYGPWLVRRLMELAGTAPKPAETK